ncbi:hypothetical protein PSH25_006536 [Micromonospora sp. PSH25]|nr:hypothetical protein [Micromonospora foliorum]MCG5436207.1 hypothetical protein [Micromonospora foliorum]
MAPSREGRDLLIVGRAASVQFSRPIRFRVIRQLDWITYDGWVWLDGYELDGQGDAVARRSIFVMMAGLRPPPTAAPRSKPTRSAAIPHVSQDRRLGRVPASPQRRAEPGRRTSEHR